MRGGGCRKLKPHSSTPTLNSVIDFANLINGGVDLFTLCLSVRVAAVVIKLTGKFFTPGLKEREKK